MGAIASNKSPKALALFRKILIASAAIPVIFPPEYFSVQAAGKTYIEMHVDGGVEAEAIYSENAVLPHNIRLSEANLLKGHKRPHKLYVILNGKMSPQWTDVKQKFEETIILTIKSFIKSQGKSDLFRLYTYAKRDGIDYNLAYVPADFTQEPKTLFDKKYMNNLFSLGYRLGSSDYKWNKYPPDYTPINED